MKKTILFFLAIYLLSSCIPSSIDKNNSDNNALKYYSLALEDYTSNNLKSADSLISIAISINPRIARYYELKGDILSTMNSFNGAINAFQQALKMKSRYPGVITKLGDIYFKQQKYNEAIDNYRKAHAQDESNLIILVKIAEAYLQKNELVVARNLLNDYLKESVKLNRKPEKEFYSTSARLYFEQKEYKKTISDYENKESSFELNRNDILVYARACFYNGDLEKGYNLVTQKYRHSVEISDLHFFRGLYFYKNNGIIHL